MLIYTVLIILGVTMAFFWLRWVFALMGYGAQKRSSLIIFVVAFISFIVIAIGFDVVDEVTSALSF
ncbi:hypothetical protein ACTHPH_21945 [Paenibacillus pasadenensis]|uniref:hypothetical protein n=1 Tax=Paenibacillus pasadenensis TaxID=217090 RepID=UPI00048F015A|nr:hypothetical protein [Paenibacillus pasadenensis]